MLISCALFAGATHAWFFDHCSAQIKLQSATFNVDVAVTSGEGVPSISPDANGMCELTTGTYTVTLKRVSEGTVGYCKITVGDVVYYSPNLTEAGFSFDLTITLPEGAEPVSVTFTPVWSDVTKVEGVTTINSETPISYSAVTQSYAMRGTEPEPDEPAESGTNETAESEPGGTTQPGTEEKNNSEEVPSGTDGGSSGNEGGENGEGGSTVEDTTGSDTGNVPSGVE